MTGRTSVEAGEPVLESLDGGSLQPVPSTLRQCVAGERRLSRLCQRLDIAEPILALCRIGLQGRLEVRQCGGHLVHLDGQDSQIVVRVGVVGLCLKNGAVKPFGILQEPVLVVIDGLSDRLVNRRWGGF